MSSSGCCSWHPGPYSPLLPCPRQIKGTGLTPPRLQEEKGQTQGRHSKCTGVHGQLQHGRQPCGQGESSRGTPPWKLSPQPLSLRHAACQSQGRWAELGLLQYGHTLQRKSDLARGAVRSLLCCTTGAGRAGDSWPCPTPQRESQWSAAASTLHRSLPSTRALRAPSSPPCSVFPMQCTRFP